MKQEEKKTSINARNSFLKSKIFSFKNKKKYLSVNNSANISKVDLSNSKIKTNKSINRSLIFSAKQLERGDINNKKLLFNKIKQYNNEKNKHRAKSSLPSKSRSIIFDLKYISGQKIPSHLNVLNLILKKSASQVDINMIERKLDKITKLSETNKLNSTTRKRLYEYNIIYGHNTNNLIKSYTPKLIQYGSNIKKNTNIVDNLQIFSEEQIKELFYQKCNDLNVPIKDELMNRFMNFIKEKCVNRVINLSDCCLGFNSMIVLADILKKNIDICSRIILTKNDFGDDGIELLLECLEGNNNIVELNLSSNSLGVSGGMSIFRFLLKQESIICLDLSSKEGIYRNRVCADGIKLITKVLRNNFFLEKIDLSSNSIKNEGMKYIVNGLITNESLKYLIIPNNEITEKGILYLESKIKVCKLKYLNLGSNPIGNIGLISLGNCMSGKKLAEIISLNVEECSIGFDAFYQFIKKICKNHKIQNLIFNRNNLSGKKWDLLEDAFKVLSLKSISLGSCGLSKDIREVSNVFRVNPTLKYLDLSHNQIIDENFEIIQLYPKENLILEELDLSSNFISDKGAIKFFKNLIDNRTLLKINFYDNNLENETAEVILDMLKTNTHILNINVNCNNISIRKMVKIKNQIQNNRVIEKVKYIPKLKNELRDLEFDPNEINEIKNKLKYYNIERENLTKKFRKEIKDLQIKKKDNIKSYKSVDDAIKKIEKQNNILENEINNIKEEDNNEGISFNREINLMKDKISSMESQKSEIYSDKFKLKDNYNEKIIELKREYGHKMKYRETLQIDLLSFKNKLKLAEKKYKQKLDYLEKLKSALIKKE